MLAARDLPVGTTLAAEHLTQANMPERFAGGIATDIDQLLGRAVVLAVTAGSPMFEAGLSAGDLTVVTPAGLVVVPLRLDSSTTAVLAPGDLVDLVGLTTDGPRHLARSALVLPPRVEPVSASGLFSAGQPQPGMVLVAVSPDEAPGLASAAHSGQVTAILVP